MSLDKRLARQARRVGCDFSITYVPSKRGYEGRLSNMSGHMAAHSVKDVKRQLLAYMRSAESDSVTGAVFQDNVININQ